MTAAQPQRAIARVGGDGFDCGGCGSADDWADNNTSVWCGNCGATVPTDQLDAFYPDDDGV